MNTTKLLSTLILASAAGAFAQAPQVAVSHSQSYFRTQTTAVSLVRVTSFTAGAFNIGFTADPNFTVTRINAPATWVCNLSHLTCSRANNGQAAFELIQFIGTIGASAGSTATNQASLTGDGLSSPVTASDTVPVYAPSKVVQWGSNSFGQLAGLPTTPGFTSVAQGYRSVAALTLDGTIQSWGDLSYFTVPAPTGSGYLAVVAGIGHCAALTNDGHVVVWGLNSVGQLNNPPTSAGFIAIASTNTHTIALTNDGHLVQFGGHLLSDIPTGGGFIAIAGGYAHGLALNYQGVVTQWGSVDLNQRSGLPPGGGYIAIAAPNYNGLSQRQDRTLQEWGSTSNNPTAGLYSGAVTTFGGGGPFSSGAWAMPSDGSIAIWGDVFGSYQTGKPTAGGYVQGSVSLGLNAANALLPVANPTATGGTPQSTLLNTAFATALSVKVVDALNTPVTGLNITFTAPGSGASGTFSNGTATITVATDASGVASATFTANGTVGSYTVNAAYPGFPSVPFSLSNTTPLAVTSILDGGQVAYTAATLYSPGVGYLNVNFNQAVANATDTGNYLLVGRADGQDPATTNCSSLAGGDSDIGVSAVSFNSGSNYAQVVFAAFPAGMRFRLIACATNRTNPANSLKAATGGSTLTSDFVSTPLGSLPILAATSVTSGSPGGTNVGEGASVTPPIAALYVNMNTAPVSSTVSAATVKLYSGSVANPGCATVATAVGGTASVSGNAIVFTPNSPLSATGSYHLVVCGTVIGGNGAALGSSGYGASGVDVVRNFSISSVATTMTKAAGDGQSTIVGTAFPTTLKVSVTDQSGAAMSGVSVTFAIVAGGTGAGGSFASSATVATGADGTATAPTLTANSSAGAFTVVATAGSLSQTFNLTNTALTPVTITVPAGVGFLLNGSNYTGTQTVSLAPGSYTLATAAVQSLASGTQAVFTTWSDSGALAHLITVGASPLPITGNFKTQHQLTITPTANGSVTPGSGSFYDTGTVVNVTATASPSFAFSAWTGPVASSSSPSTTVTMDAPKTISATFVAQVTPTITWSNPADILFGSALGPVQYNATASVPGTFVYTPAPGTVPPVGANQTLSVTFTPTDAVHYLPATRTVSINVVSSPSTPASLGITNALTRDPNSNEIVVRITVSNTGSATAAAVQLTNIRIGTTATTTAVPVALGNIAYGQSATATIRIPGSAGSRGAAAVLAITGLYNSATAFGGSFRTSLP